MWVEPSQITAQHGLESAKMSLTAVLKTIVSVVGGAGSVIALLKTCGDMLQNRSLVAKRNSELERAGKFADLLGKFSKESVPKEHQETLSNAVHGCLQQCFANVASLNTRLAEISLDPNSSMRARDKILLSFRPASWRGWALHLLTYASVAWCAWYVFKTGLATGNSGFSTQTFLTTWQGSEKYLGLGFSLVMFAIFRRWSLEERRRSYGYRKPADHLARWLVMRFPENTRMLLAQIMFFLTCMALLTAVYSTVAQEKGWDVVLGLSFGSLLLIPALIFRHWALAELVCHEQKPQLVRWKAALFSGFFKNIRAYGLLRALYFVALFPLALMTLIALFYGLLLLIAGQVLLGIGFLLIIPLPNLIFNYALFRSLKIKRSLAQKKDSEPDEAPLALSVPA
jgi:hypothetical protein